MTDSDFDCKRCACCSESETGKSFEYANGLCNSCQTPYVQQTKTD